MPPPRFREPRLRKETAFVASKLCFGGSRIVGVRRPPVPRTEATKRTSLRSLKTLFWGIAHRRCSPPPVPRTEATEEPAIVASKLCFGESRIVDVRRPRFREPRLRKNQPSSPQNFVLGDRVSSVFAAPPVPRTEATEEPAVVASKLCFGGSRIVGVRRPPRFREPRLRKKQPSPPTY